MGAASEMVSDTGPGIRPDHISHIFNRLWKYDHRGSKGTGLGLFIARGIIDAHGGTIWVESDPGAGATFYFTLPQVEARRAPSLEASIADERVNRHPG